MAANRATTRRRSARIAFDDDDAPVVKRARTETNSIAKKVNGTTKKTDKKGESGGHAAGRGHAAGGTRLCTNHAPEMQDHRKIS